MSSISNRIKQIQSEIPTNVRLVAISKQTDARGIEEAYNAGIRDFGENRLQDALVKQEKLKHLEDITWHFIGHLQSRKAKQVLLAFNWIHSIDSLKLAEKLNKLAEELSISPQVFLQVKILPDPNKYGWIPEELIADLSIINQYKNLQIKGLMTILPLGLSELDKREAFESTKKLASQINQENWSNLNLSELSMGMSGDYKEAIKAGATMVRIGSLIFANIQENIAKNQQPS